MLGSTCRKPSSFNVKPNYVYVKCFWSLVRCFIICYYLLCACDTSVLSDKASSDTCSLKQLIQLQFSLVPCDSCFVPQFLSNVTTFILYISITWKTRPAVRTSAYEVIIHWRQLWIHWQLILSLTFWVWQLKYTWNRDVNFHKIMQRFIKQFWQSHKMHSPIFATLLTLT